MTTADDWNAIDAVTGTRKPSRMTGTVIRVLANKGYAFIRGEDRVSRFAHALTFSPTSAFDTLHQGQAVEFEAQEDVKGPRAVNVKVL